MAEDVLKALANPTNQAILSLLAIEPTYPRRVSELLSLGESDVSRRLSRMEKAGLVTSGWQHQDGKNVKAYELVPEAIHVRIGPQGLSIELDTDKDEPEQRTVVDRLRMRIPEPEGFVGREEELAALSGEEPVVVVEGIAGIGKTSLLAEFAQQRQGDGDPVYYHRFRGTESLTWLAHRLGVFQARHGDRELLEAIEEGAPLTDRRELVLQALESAGQVTVFDTIERIRDEDLQDLITDAIERVREGKLVVAGRQPPRFDPTLDRVRRLRLSGLSDEDAARFFAERGVDLDEEVLATIRERLGGHPLALNLLVEATSGSDEPLDELLAGMPEREIEEYLLGEVHDHLSVPERNVLAHASIFHGPFSREDLEEIYPRNPGGALVKLRRRRLLRDDGGNYRMHSLLRSFFAERLDEPAKLHERAAEHELEKGTLESRLDAMNHLLEAGKRQRVLRLLESDLDLEEFDLIEDGYHNLYLDVLERLDPALITDPRRAALAQDELGDIRFHRGEHEQSLTHYSDAEKRFRAEGEDHRLADLAWKQALALVELDRADEARDLVARGLQEHAPDDRTRERLTRLADELGLDA